MKSLLKIKDREYVTNPDAYKSVGTNWNAWYVNGNSETFW